MSDDIRKIHQLKVDNVTNIISALSDIIFIIDSNGFFLDYYSSDPSRFLIDEKNIVGSSIYDIFSKEEADTHISFFNDSIRTGKINSFEYSIINNGIKRSFEARISKLDDFSVLSIVRDITERTNAQRELIENEKKIRRLIEANNRNQRLESLGFLAGGIAHDFNNLILGLFGSIENARNELQKGNIQDAVTTLSYSLSAFERARGLTHQLLTFSKGGKPIKRVGNVIQTLKNAIDFAFSGKNIIPVVNFENKVVVCNYDDSQISQVIDNILINAIQACLGNGRITIQTRQKFLSKNNEALLSPGEYLSITLKDNGKGIDKDIISKIFDPFFTTKEKGNGLGLAISWSIVKNHGGTISVRSDHENGTTFEVLLPVSNEKIPSQIKKDPGINPGNLRILIMDDEFLIREVTGKILTDLGFIVEKAANGNEALNKYRSAMDNNKNFDAVILDLTIPGGMGGVETLEKLKKIDPLVNAIASSGFSEDAVIANPESFGFTTSIPKPYLKENLFSVISESIIRSKDQSS